MTDSLRGAAWCVLFVAALILPAAVFAAGSEDTTATEEMEAMETDGAFNYEHEYGTYHWVTPAAFQQATGQTVGTFKESPQLAQLVSEGKLPPVEDRLPLEPLVLGREIGTYGGTLHVGGGHFVAFQYAMTPYSNYGVGLAEHTWTQGTYPNLVKSWDVEEDGRKYTLHLREGLRYSDGEPFTADDIMFWWEHIVPTNPTFPDLFTRIIISTGLYDNIVKIDDYTVRVEYSKPSDNLFWVHFGKAVPAHQKKYFSQFHPEFQDEDKLDEMVKEAGFSNWIELYEYKLDIRGNVNTERPILLAWALKQVPPDDYILERNPYFWAVDPAGNQLPYLDRIYGFVGLEPEVRDLKAQAGELDFADVPMATYRLIKEKESEGKIRGQRMAGVALNSAQLSFNLNHKDPAGARDLHGQAVPVRGLPRAQSRAHQRAGVPGSGATVAGRLARRQRLLPRADGALLPRVRSGKDQGDVRRDRPAGRRRRFPQAARRRTTADQPARLGQLAGAVGKNRGDDGRGICRRSAWTST